MDDRAKVGWGAEQAAAVPAEEFAVNEVDDGLGKDLFYFFDVALAKGIRFGREEDVKVLVAGEAGEIDRGIAVLAGEDVAIAGILEHVADKGISAD